MQWECKLKYIFPATKPPFKWEDATTVENSWGFRRDMQLLEVKSPSYVIHLLIRTVRWVGRSLFYLIVEEFSENVWRMSCEIITSKQNKF